MSQAKSEAPSVSELAERIKTLKAAHSIEAAPQRVRQKQSSAEEPVTARIRRRTESIPASDPGIRPDAAASGADATPPSETAQNLHSEPQITFHERIAKERQRTQTEPRLP